MTLEMLEKIAGKYELEACLGSVLIKQYSGLIVARLSSRITTRAQRRLKTTRPQLAASRRL